MSRRFIAAAPFVFIASAAEDGTADVSPKGDPPGFVRVLDERTLAIPDRLGNRRFDTFRNLLRNPAIGLIFLVPGVAYTLRISGTAIIVRDADLREELAVNRKVPDHVLVVAVSRVLSHCPKCMIRSGLWKPEDWPDTTDVPSFAETLIAHARDQRAGRGGRRLARRGEPRAALLRAGGQPARGMIAPGMPDHLGRHRVPGGEAGGLRLARASAPRDRRR